MRIRGARRACSWDTNRRRKSKTLPKRHLTQAVKGRSNPGGRESQRGSPLPLHSTARLLLSRPTCFFSSSKNCPFPHRPHVLARRYPRSAIPYIKILIHIRFHAGTRAGINTTAHSHPRPSSLSPTHQHQHHNHHYHSLTRNLTPILLSLLFLAGFVSVTLGWPLSHNFVHISSVLHCSISSP